MHAFFSPFIDRQRRAAALISLALMGSLEASAGAAAPPPAPRFSLSLERSHAVVRPGQQVVLAVDVQRDTGFTGAVEVVVEGLPPGLRDAAVTIPAAGSAGTLTLQAAAHAGHTRPAVVSVNGRGGGMAATAQPLTVTLRGSAGDIDTSFGGGRLLTSGGLTDDYVRGVAVQADGKVLVAGHGVFGGATGTDFMLVRYLRDGGLDAGFGKGGKVSTAFDNGARSDEAQTVAVQPDGKILVAGSSDQGSTGYDFALARYHPDGRLDAGFGRNGRVTTALGSGADKAYALLLQPDGKILLAGDSSQGANGSDFALVRYNADGSLDAGFGNGGKVLTAVGSDSAREAIYALALQASAGVSRIVAAGGEGDFIAVAYRADGTLDPGFGKGGIVNGLFGSVTGAARGIAVTLDNELVLAGHRDHDFAAVRLLPDGRLDDSFGKAGRVVVAVSADNWDEATALVQQVDGRLLLGGWAYSGNSSSGDTVLLRLNADGSRDTGFGAGGIRITPVAAGGRSDAGRALALQPDERVPVVRVLQAGEAGGGSDLDIALLRHWL